MNKKILLCAIGFAVLAIGVTVRYGTNWQAIENFCESKEEMAREHGGGEPGYYAQWFDTHKNEYGEIPSGLLQEWLDHDNALASKRLTSVFATVENLKSPTVKQGGRTRGILIDATNDNNVWAGSVSGGLFRSVDMGESWLPVNDANSSLAVTCLAQNPLNTQEIFYGTGEWRGATGPTGDGLWKSTNGGVSFTQIPSTATITDMDKCNFMKHSLTDVNTLYVGTSNGLYRTIDDGVTWTKLVTGNVSGLLTFADGSVLVTMVAGAVYRSPTGAAASFVRINQTVFPSGSLIGLVCLENCRSFPNVVYAWFTNEDYNGEAHNSLWKSSNAGRNWQKIICNPAVGSGYQAYNGVIAVNPTDTLQLYVASVSASASIDGGLNWDDNAEYGHSDNHVVAYFTGEPNWFMLGNDGGVWKTSFDGTYSLTNVNIEYITLQFYAGDYGRWGKWAVGGAQDNGTWRFRSSTSTPLTKVGGADGGYAFISRQDSTLAYAAWQNGVILRTNTFTNNSVTINTTITPPFRSSESKDFINEFQINPADGKQLYVRSGQGIWRTLNRGTSWSRLNDTTTNIGGIMSLAITNETDPTVYALGRATFISFANAATCAPVTTYSNRYLLMSATIRNDAPGELSIDPHDLSTLYYGYTSYSSPSRAWKVTGANTATPVWTSIMGNLPLRLPVYQIQADPIEPNTLYAATDFGLYYTYDGGVTWSKETRVPNVPILNLKFRANADGTASLFAFTHGRGLWYLTVSYMATHEVAEGKLNLSLFPNPSSQYLRVNYDNLPISPPHSTNKISVFDLQGKLICEKVPDGISETVFDTQTFAAGTYLLRLQTNGKEVTKKFVVMR
ncbi:MAG: hypothetical protein RI894_1734 [Bacteroidota bacterium]|jgi:hypothetical protein